MSKVIIAGSRGFTEKDKERVYDTLHHLSDYVDITTVISGTADGIDKIGEQWALDHGIPVEQFRPDWTKHGKAAGPIRNEEMAKAAEACIVLWDGKSKGAAHMIRAAIKYGLKLFVITMETDVTFSL